MKEITIGIAAHVDAGKTTLSEALLYETGQVRKLGRVDHGDTVLDSDELEKKRGITIFSHEAQLKKDDFKINLLDTPGHIDFANQTEQVFDVVDYAILVISASDGVTSYTRTLWNLLADRQVPVFIFVNKMDNAGVEKTAILQQIQEQLDNNCVDFTAEDDDFYENVATCDEQVLEQYLDQNTLSAAVIQDLIQKRATFPVYFGSALKVKGIATFFAGLEKWTKAKPTDDQFAARIFKISHDQKGERLTWLKLLGGQLQTKAELNQEKVNQIRSYNGAKFAVVPEIKAGQLATVTGPVKTYPGQGLGINDSPHASLRPVLTYQVQPKQGDLYAVLDALKLLEDENPQLHVQWNEELQEIHVQIMGAIQLEVLQQILLKRFNLQVSFNQGSILYQETITKPIEAVGHFEPLRHYAEVHLLLEPGPANSGLVFENKCDLEVLTKNWQHQIMTALKSKEHLGVLTGAPITDMKITLIGGKGSLVHSVGGDFREATYRAVRQGLMELKQKQACQLLEPWYKFHLEIPADQVGRALTDIQKMHGSFDPPVTQGNFSVIAGQAPVAEMQDYATEIRNYSHGQGHLECIFSGYQVCHDAEKIIVQKNYDPVSDLENTPNSVFCAHGAGHTVTWDEVPAKAQYSYTYPLN